jgi:hypothetical protein
MAGVTEETASSINKSKYSISHNLLAGAFAGAVARLLTAPFDVIKIRFQMQSGSLSNKATKYKSILQAFKTVIFEEGVTALWKGNLSATYLWISYAMVQFSLYGILCQWGEAIVDQLKYRYLPERTSSSHRKSTLKSQSLKSILLFVAVCSISK